MHENEKAGMMGQGRVGDVGGGGRRERVTTNNWKWRRCCPQQWLGRPPPQPPALRHRVQTAASKHTGPHATTLGGLQGPVRTMRGASTQAHCPQKGQTTRNWTHPPPHPRAPSTHTHSPQTTRRHAPMLRAASHPHATHQLVRTDATTSVSVCRSLPTATLSMEQEADVVST